MKKIFFLILITSITAATYAQKSKSNKVDTSLHTFEARENMAEFPGGVDKFYHYVGHDVNLPQVVLLLGFTGKAVVNFTVAENGRVTDVAPATNSGIGIEEAIAQVIARSPTWKPALQNGIQIAIKMSMPFTLDIQVDTIKFQILRQAQDGYFFRIKDNICDIEQAEKLLGPVFQRKEVDTVAEYTGTEVAPKDKKKLYLITIKP